MTDEPPRATGGDLAGVSLAVGAAIAFGTLAIFAKYAYADGADPLPLLALRFAVATGLVGLLRVALRRPGPTRRQATGLFLLGAFGYAFEASLFFAALENAPASVVGLVFYSYPVWTALIGLATGLESYRPQLVAALVLGTAGVALVFSAPVTGLKGPLFALAAAVAVAFYLIGIQVWTKGVDPSASAMWTSAGAACSTGVVALVARQSFPIGATRHAAALGLASAIAFVALYAAISRIGSSRAAIAAMMEPVTTVVLGAMFLDETITWRVVGGAVLVLAALPVVALRGRVRPSEH